MPATKTKLAPKAPSPVKPAEPPRAAAAFAAIQPEMLELLPENLAKINIDIPQAVSIALGVLPGLAFLRPTIAELPDFKIDHFDKLETYALGAWYAHLLALPPASASNPLQPLLEEATKLRANLLSDAEALATRGHLDPEAVQVIRAGHGQVDTANDLVALSALMGSKWDEIATKTAATAEEVHRAGDLGPLLLAALGVREHSATATPAEAADRKVRAFTLFTVAYDQLRRAMLYLRWNEGDADLLAPSLYKGRGGSRSASAAKDAGREEAATAEPATGETPAVVKGGQ
jgi:hypothetical protein